MKKKVKKNDHGRGFKRTQKQWENSFADHVGKFIDRLHVDDLLMIGLAIQGVRVTQRLEGAFIGPVGLKLAQSSNLPAGAAGLVLLGGLGLLSVVSYVPGVKPPVSGEGENIVCPPGYWAVESPLESGNFICILKPGGLY